MQKLKIYFGFYPNLYAFTRILIRIGNIYLIRYKKETLVETKVWSKSLMYVYEQYKNNIPFVNRLQKLYYGYSTNINKNAILLQMAPPNYEKTKKNLNSTILQRR